MSKLTLNKMKSITSKPTTKTTTITYRANDEDVEVKFDTNLSLAETNEFIDFVVDKVFTYSDEYVPEYRDVVTFLAMIKYMSNIPLPKENKENYDINLCRDWMESLGIIEYLKYGVEINCYGAEGIEYLEDWYGEINALITDKIEFKKQEILAFPKAEFQNLCFTVDNFFSMISEFGEKFKSSETTEWLETAKKIAGMDETKITNAVLDFNTGKEVDAETININTEE